LWKEIDDGFPFNLALADFVRNDRNVRKSNPGHRPRGTKLIYSERCPISVAQGTTGMSVSTLSLFDTLPLTERLFVRARLATAPLEEIAARAPKGHVVDVGCGHGVLTALLAGDPQRTVLGIDPDERKIELARASAGRLPNVSIRVATCEQLAEASEFDAVVICDVLYLPQGDVSLLPPQEGEACQAALDDRRQNRSHHHMFSP
jgi:SAM-dependent methyltransferase